MKGLNIAHSADLRSAQEELRKKIEEFNQLGSKTDNEVAVLFRRREESVRQIGLMNDYVSKISNCPESAVLGARRAQAYASSLKEEWARHEDVDAQADMSTGKTGASVGIGGAAIGGATALLGPSAAMAIATTFGTASTGAAISALAGGAATNAALAWLGGGAIAAGGGGIAGGASVLALFGPIGWAIAGTSLVGGVFFSSVKNKKAIEEINEKISTVQGLIESLENSLDWLKKLSIKTYGLNCSIKESLCYLAEQPSCDYNDASYPKEDLFSMVEEAKLLGKLANTKLSDNGAE